MLERLQYQSSNNTVTEEPAMPVRTNRTRKKNTKRTAGKSDMEQYTIMDLVAIFTDEAERVCSNKDIASLIAVESLNDYFRHHVTA